MDTAVSLITEQNVNETSSLRRSALGIACANGSIEVVDALLKKGADITVANNDGWTPRFVASVSGHIEVVRLILEKGADITVANKNR
jgi:ankyrin repeat protein